MPESQVEQFIQEINPWILSREATPPRHIWHFRVLGGLNVRGKVVNHMMDPHGTPVTIMVETPGETLELPWTSIQTITMKELC